MAAIELTKHIDAPPDRVFAAASDFRGAADRISAITKMEVLTEGPIGVGTRFRETRFMFKREATEEMTVKTFDPPNGYALGAESCGCRYHTEFRFRPNGSGTDVNLSFDAQPLSFVAKIMSFLLMPFMKKACVKACEQDLEDLKASLESAR